MIKQSLMFIILSLSSLAALAVPTVTDVEATINSGEYAKAKEQIKEVLKVHPDSVVANKYMLEIIKIEYAGSLKPSVEYKVYEDKLKQIEAVKQKRLEEERLAAEKKRKAEFWAGVRTFFSWLFGLLIVVALSVSGFIVLRKRRAAKEETERKRKWKRIAEEKFVHINDVLSRHLKDRDAFQNKYGINAKLDAIALNDDNLESMQAVYDDDYSEEMINRHFKDAYRFMDNLGLE